MKFCTAIDSSNNEWQISENEGKNISRAVQLLFMTSGNRHLTMTMLSLETGVHQILLVGALNLAYEMYNYDPVIFTEWQED
jgi:hypothetical protein